MSQLFKVREGQVTALHAGVHTDSHQGLSEEAVLGLADGMIASIVYHENLNGHLMMDNGLQFLQIHLDRAVSGHQENILALIRRVNFSLALPVRILRKTLFLFFGKIHYAVVGTDSRRQSVTHGSHTVLADKTSALFNDIALSAGNTGRTISHHGNLVFRSPLGKLFHKGVNIGQFSLSLLKILRKHGGVVCLIKTDGIKPS